MELAIQTMKDGFYNFQERIDLTGCGVTPAEIGDLFIFVIKNDPYLFFVDTKLSYYYKSDGSYFQIAPRYNVIPEEAGKMIKYCRAEVQKIAARADRRMSEVEKALFIYDILCAEYRYDSSYINDDMYKFLSTKTGTCQGYTWAYMAVLRELGMECSYVASDSINHIWNMVKIDGEWYHCDATWDDGEVATHRHFLNSDQKARDMGHRDWYSAYGQQCTSQKYDNVDFTSMIHKVASGDGNHDGRVDLYDLLLVRRRIADQNSTLCEICADVNADFVCDLTDVELLRQNLIYSSTLP